MYRDGPKRTMWTCYGILMMCMCTVYGSTMIPVVGPLVKGYLELVESESEESLSLHFSLSLTPLVSTPTLLLSFHAIPTDLNGKLDKQLEGCSTLPQSTTLLPLPLNLTVYNHNLPNNATFIVDTELNTFIGHSLLIRSAENAVLGCANIFSHENDDVQVFQSQFYGPEVVGSVYAFVLNDRLKILTKLRANELEKGTKIPWSLTTIPNSRSHDGNSEHNFNCHTAANLTQPQSSLNTHFDLNGDHMITIASDRLDLAMSVLVLFRKSPQQKPSRTNAYRLSRNGNKILDCAIFHHVIQKFGIATLAQRQGSSEETGEVADSRVNLVISQNSPFHALRISPALNSFGEGWNLCPTPFFPDDNCKDFIGTMAASGGGGTSCTSISDSVLLPEKDGEFTHQLSLYGPSSSLLKSLVRMKPLGRDSLLMDGDSCALIRGQGTRMAVAEFHYPVVGRLKFVQDEDNPDSTTIISGTLRHLFDSFSESYEWMILRGTIGSSHSQLACTEVKNSLFDPINLGIKGCSDFTPEWCPIGTGSLKFGPIKIAGYTASVPDRIRSRTRVAASGLPLAGPMTIVGQTIKIMIDENQNYTACANVTLLPVSVAEANLIRYGPTKMPSVGTFTVVESPDLDSTISLSLADPRLSNPPHNLSISIHLGPVDLTQTHSKHPCQPQSTGELWRFGNSLLGHSETIIITQSLTSWDSFRHMIFSNTGKSFLGKSVVLTSRNQMICGTILPTLPVPPNTLTAHFQESWIQGTVKFIQVPVDGLNFHTPTIVLLDLQIDQQLEHEELQLVVSEYRFCNAIHQPYDPFFLTQSQSGGKESSKHYMSHCLEDQLLCAVGDISSKIGLTSAQQNRHSFLIYGTPLTGPFSVSGKTLQISGKNHEACAVIEKWTVPVSRKVFVEKTDYSRTKVHGKLLHLLNATAPEVAVSYNRTKFGSFGCLQYDIELLGPRSVHLGEEFDRGDVSHSMVGQECSRVQEKYETMKKEVETTALEGSSSIPLLNSSLFVILITVLYFYFD